MNNQNLDIVKATQELLMEWLHKKSYLTKPYKKSLFEVAMDYKDDVTFFYSINKALLSKEEYVCDKDKDLIFQKKDSINELIYKGEKMVFTDNQMKELLAGIIDIQETILPLGSVVDLKKEFFKEQVKLKDVDKVRIVITHRFLYGKDDTVYFPYAGVVYPTGMFGSQKVINFTSALIEKVVHKGFSNIQDEAYVYLMKRELILDHHMHSYAFASSEEFSKLETLRQKEG